MTMVAMAPSRIAWPRLAITSLGGGARWACRGFEIIHRRLHAALAVRHAGEREAHLDTGEGADDGQVVGVAEMADAEHLAGELGEAGAERNVEMLERGLAEAVGVLAFGHHHRGERRGIILRLAAPDFQPPAAHRAPRRLGVAVVPREYVLESFLVQHVDRFRERVE